MTVKTLNISRLAYLVMAVLMIPEGLVPTTIVVLVYTGHPRLPGELWNVEWYGMGSHETYPDRQSSSREDCIQFHHFPS
jgi:hypothetical protein